MLLKIIKKITGICGFKLIDKNLIKNSRLLSKNNLYSLDFIFEYVETRGSKVCLLVSNESILFELGPLILIKAAPL